MALVKIDGQELELPDDQVKSDKQVRDALSQYYPGAANSDIKRETKDGTEVVTVTKRAGSKGSLDAVIAALDDAPEYVHPALRYNVAGWSKSDDERLEEALLGALDAEAQVGRIAEALDEAEALPALTLPEGF